MKQSRPTFWETFRDLVDFALRPELQLEVERANQEYFGTAHPPQAVNLSDRNDETWEDGAEYLAFLEWLIFDRSFSRGHNPLVEAYLEASARVDAQARDDIRAWTTSHMSFYEVTTIAVHGIFVRDLLQTGGEIEQFVAEPPENLNLRGGELIMVRLLKWDGVQHLAGSINVFPDAARESLLGFMEEMRNGISDDNRAEVLREVLPALCRFQTARTLDQESLFPGGYPDEMTVSTVETLVLHGHSCIERGEWTEALLCFQRALYADPLHLEARSGVGLVHLNRGDIEQARRAFESILKTHPDEPVALLNLGNVAIMSGRLQEAHNLLEKAHHATAPRIRAHASFNLGLVELALDKHEQAVRSFREASRLADHLDTPVDAAGLHFRIGSNLAASHRHDAALTFFRKSVKCVPDFAQGRLYLADSYAQLDRWRDAVREYRCAIRLGDGNGHTWHSLGRCLLRLEHWQQAEEALWHAIELLPGLVEAHIHLAQAMMAQDRLLEARHRFEVALYHAPRSVEVLVMVGEAARRLGDYKASSRYLRRALRLEPRHVEARGLLAQVRKEERKPCT